MPRSDKVASLLDENQRLRARLKRCDEARQEAERQIEELQRRVRRKESEWMAEYDKHVQALLEIIKHNEEEKEQLKESEERWRKAAEAVPPLVTKNTRSSQTETPLRAEKPSSVRFAEEEQPSVDAKTKVKIARMQVLFEQLQASNDQHFSKSSSHASSNAEKLRSGNGRRSVELDSNFKTTVLGRLQDQQTESNTVRQQHTTKSMGKTIETQTDNISPTQEAGERNRPLDERLAAQQKVLDHLLCSKLRANGPEQNDLVPFTVSGTDIAASGHGKAQHKCEQTMKPVTSASSSLAIQIESVPATMDRGPLSPLAA